MTEGIELKTVNPVVFDGPKYCENGHDKCENLDNINWKCKHFRDSKTLEIDIILRWFRKCQACKDHYQRNKSNG